jgi:hypothetical protein
MKTKAIVSILILTLVVLIVAGSCATKRKAISDEDFFKAWSGTWINTEFKGGSDSQKMINHPDGTEESFGMLTSTTPSRSYKYTILEKWLDSKGTIISQ